MQSYRSSIVAVDGYGARTVLSYKFLNFSIRSKWMFLSRAIERYDHERLKFTGEVCKNETTVMDGSRELVLFTL